MKVFLDDERNRVGKDQYCTENIFCEGKLMNETHLNEKSWVPANGVSISTWRPFPELLPEWVPGESVIRPFKEIENARNTEKNSRTKVLSERCRSLLKGWWEGDSHKITEQERTFYGSHFHCYSTRGDSGRIHRSFNDWIGHPNCIDPSYWWCSSIKNAADHYSWSKYPGGTFEQLALALQSAMALGKVRLTEVCCLKILDWGGVRHRSQKTIDWITRARDRGTLIEEIKVATALLCPASQGSLDDFGQGMNQFPMNAGSTKIFSAAALDFSAGFNSPKQDVIIFDGRVGAALGLLARRLSDPQPVPREFLFPRGVETYRNPSTSVDQFPSMSGYGVTDQIRAEFARTASRAVQEVLNSFRPSTEFVLAEKALFMIGYNVTGTCAGDSLVTN